MVECVGFVARLGRVVVGDVLGDVKGLRRGGQFGVLVYDVFDRAQLKLDVNGWVLGQALIVDLFFFPVLFQFIFHLLIPVLHLFLNLNFFPLLPSAGQ
jgi:hypothetical protein